jgi:hypothetical protein
MLSLHIFTESAKVKSGPFLGGAKSLKINPAASESCFCLMIVRLGVSEWPVFGSHCGALLNGSLDKLGMTIR